MTLPIRVLDTGLRPARWNIAMTAALVERHASGGAADTIRFHRYPASVLLGRGQDLGKVADETYCKEHGIDIARRVTGGGAVFMSPRMLAWEVIIGRSGLGADWEAITQRLCEAVAVGLSRFGVAARFRPPNDIEVGGLKVSGSAGYTEGRTAVVQGTVLIEDDASTMARVLLMDEHQLRNRVTCLADQLERTPSMDEVKEKVLGPLAQTLERAPSQEEPAAADLTLAESLLRDELGSDEFVLGSHAVGAPGGTV